MDAFIMQIDPLIQEVQSLFRKEAGISSFNHEDPSIFDLPTITESISQFDPSPPQCRCHRCNGRLLRDVKSLVCVYCGVEQKRDTPPEPLRYRDTLAFRWLLGALDLDGSEIVGPPIGADEVKNENPTSNENISISDLLDFEIKWPSESDRLQSKTRSYKSHFGASSSEIFLERLGGSLSQPQAEKSLQNSSGGLSKMASSESVISIKFNNAAIPSSFLSDEPSSAADVSNAIGTDEPVWEADFQSAAPLSDLASISMHKNTDNEFVDGRAHKESKNYSILPTTMSTCKGSDPVENTSSHTTESDVFLQEHQSHTSVADASEKNEGFETNESFYNFNDFNGSSSYIENNHDSYTKESSSGFLLSNGNSVGEDLFKSDADVVQVETSDRKLDLFSAVSNTQNDSMSIDNIHSKNLFMTSDSSGKVWDCISATKSGGDTPKVQKDAETLISEMHDLCFMLEQDLCIPSNPTKSS